MRKIVANIFSCNWETYKKVYQDAIKRAYMKDGIEVSNEEISVQLEVLPGDTIQSQRRPTGKHKRIISVYENDVLKYIIGFSNTGYDEDRYKEAQENPEKEYNYGNNDWHSNTYLCQGINKIFDYYYESKKDYPDVKLYFYLLDVETKTYPHNLSNTINYRKLATIGFEILNIDKIRFDVLEPIGFSVRESYRNLGYVSFNKFANDILYTSNKKNSLNVPSYLKCVDLNYDINVENDDQEITYTNELRNEKYIYTFKTLGAESYDSFLTMWTLQVLAERENKQLEFLFSSEKSNFRLGQSIEEARYTTDFPTPITDLFAKIGLDIKYENSSEMLQQFRRENSQYELAKQKNILRNQELFRNNIRAKGIPTKCFLCNCEVEEILEAAHLWGVAEIKNADKQTINEIINIPSMNELIDQTNPHNKEDFYKRYVMANSGDNGIWLCSNHHGLFDSHYFCFDSENGKVLFDISANDEAKKFFSEITLTDALPNYVLNERTKLFLDKNRITCIERKKANQ